MRDIEFRGKRKDNGEWVYGNLIKDPDLEVTYINGYNYYSGENGLEREPFEVEVIPETVGQYTGLNDKNGTRIFEGDIVKDEYLLGVVKYATAQEGFDGMCGFMVDDIYDGLQNYNGFWHQVEVIGNIHDTPELLKGGESE